MSAVRPEVSVVVPTCNRAASLPGLVAALAAQHEVSSELLIVDDCSSDNTWKMLNQLRLNHDVELRPLRTARRSGPAAARNIGWRAARSSLVAFTDDDCLPQAGWLEMLLEASASANLVQGLTEVDPAQAEGRGPFARILVVTSFSWKFETCNVAYRRSLLEALGGFDERFPAPFGEDVDLGWRALERGASTGWVPDAVVLHAVHTTGRLLPDWIAQLRYASRCQYAAAMVSRHPQLRRHLHRGLFYKDFHVSTLLLLGGVAGAARSRRWSLVAAGPWIDYRVRRSPLQGSRRWLWRTLPLALAVDVTEVLATVWGGLKHGTLLL